MAREGDPGLPRTTRSGVVTRVIRLCYTLHEPVLFVSREFGSLYQTEPFLGHYAQAYALGLAPTVYGRPGRQGPQYATELASLVARGLYLTPASPVGPVRLRFERFNALGEGRRSRMDQGVVVDSLDVLLSGKKGRATNRPQQGTFQFLDRGSVFEAFAIVSGDAKWPVVPSWVRLGKTLGKAHVATNESPSVTPADGAFASAAYLATSDLPQGLVPESFDLLSVPPVPILRRAQLTGPHLQTRFGALPEGLMFRFPS